MRSLPSRGGRYLCLRCAVLARACLLGDCTPAAVGCRGGLSSDCMLFERRGDCGLRLEVTASRPRRFRAVTTTLSGRIEAGLVYCAL
eukprot:4993809-Prymnesium_polylepis.1